LERRLMRLGNFKLSIIIVSTLVLIQIACIIFGAPVRSIPDTKDLIEVHEIPRVLKRGEVGLFSLRTVPGNTCIGGIIYSQMGSSQNEAIDLPDLKASSDGICQWNWEVPLEAEEGIATFSAAVEQDGIHDSIPPQTFCIERCPWGVQTVQP
jgi:hypothetical protein